jgi:hypothetical protein
MNKEFKCIAIGDDFELFTGRNYKNTTGCILEINQEGDFTLVVYLDKMTPEEEFLLSKSKITVKQIREYNYVLFLMQFGNTDFIFEISFNPFLYKDNRRNIIGKSNMVLMVGVDSNTNKIKTLRQFNLPKQMFMSLITQSKNNDKYYSEKYTRWINDLDNRYSVIKLWAMATYIGKMGERYI